MKNKVLSTILVVALLVAMLFGLTACGENGIKRDAKSGAEKVVKEYFECVGEKDFDKAFKLIDWQGYVMSSEEYYEYDELEEEYEEFAEEYEDEISQMIEMVDEMSDYMKDAMDEYEKFSVEVKNVGKAEKVEDTKNIYSVEIKVKTTIKQDEDYDEETNTEKYEIYVMKKDSKYYIIGGIDDFMETL